MTDLVTLLSILSSIENHSERKREEFHVIFAVFFSKVDTKKSVSEGLESRCLDYGIILVWCHVNGMKSESTFQPKAIESEEEINLTKKKNLACTHQFEKMLTKTFV